MNLVIDITIATTAYKKVFLTTRAPALIVFKGKIFLVKKKMKKSQIYFFLCRPIDSFRLEPADIQCRLDETFL